MGHAFEPAGTRGVEAQLRELPSTHKRARREAGYSLGQVTLPVSQVTQQRARARPPPPSWRTVHVRGSVTRGAGSTRAGDGQGKLPCALHFNPRILAG